MTTINLYTMPNCPKCRILKEKCAENKYIQSADVDFQICEVNSEDDNDAYMLFLKEKGVENMPVLLVNNDLYDFSEAMAFLRKKTLYGIIGG